MMMISLIVMMKDAGKEGYERKKIRACGCGAADAWVMKRVLTLMVM
jgi:hypothetical protein